MGLNQFDDGPGIFQDVAIRQALLLAVNREAIVEAAFFGYVEVAETTMAVPWAYDPDDITARYGHYPERAAGLLDQAGWVLGDDGVRVKDGIRFEVSGWCQAGAITETIAAIVQEFWRQVGVVMEIQTEQSAAFFSRIQETHDYDVFFHSFGSGDVDQRLFWNCETGIALQWVGYCNEELDALMNEASTELDSDRRRGLTNEVLNQVMETLPVGPLVAPLGLAAIRSEVHNVYPNAYNFAFNAHTWWKGE
jgi:peptide/nickel transport system substrate-binding protein